MENLEQLVCLEVPQPSLGMKIASKVLSGVGEVRSQIEPYTKHWNDNNVAALQKNGPLLVVVGDSSGLGVGASSPQKGYVQLVWDYLKTQDASWRVINLSISGGKAKDALRDYVPVVSKLKLDKVICCVGSNDIFWSLSTTKLNNTLTEIVSELPSDAIIAGLAGASPRSFVSNGVLKKAATKRGQTFVTPWGRPGPEGLKRIAQDKFHPNDLGYELMAGAFIEVLAGD